MFDVVTLVFSAARLSLSDFVVPRSCATVSFSAFTSSATWSLATSRDRRRRGAEHRAELGDAERAADRAEARRDRDAGGEQRKAGRARLCGRGLLGLRLGALNATMALPGSASCGGGRKRRRLGSLRLDLGFDLSGSALASIFGLDWALRPSGFGGSVLGAAISAASGLALRRNRRRVYVRVGSILGVSSLDMGSFPMEKIHPLVTFRSYRPVNGLLPRQGSFRVNIAGIRYLCAPPRWSMRAHGRAGSSRRRRAAAACP